MCPGEPMTLPTITIYDTLASRKRPLETLEPGRVGIYVCGVTVYDLAHIGHGRTFITFDHVVRYLRYRGYEVRYVRNHTDIDDKIINRANERGVDPLVLSAQYIECFDADMERLGLVAPDVAPKVSEHLDEIVAMVETLIERGHAYAVDGDVYYAVESFENYGRLSGRVLDDMRAGERIAIDDRKRNPFDFALWKSVKPGEPSWESPWGPGRPGWHIECSVMSTKHLGNTFDIHGGGSDLQFPHHENEIAQSEGATGCTFSNYWMHSAMLNIDGEKMSKSLDNFWTIRDVLDQQHPETVRYFMMTAHYRKQINYAPQYLDAARDRVQYLYTTRQAINELWSRAEKPAANAARLQSYLEQLHRGMDDDFNTSVALSVVNEAARDANEILNTKKLAKKPELLEDLAACDELMDVFGRIFGIGATDPTVILLEIRELLAKQFEVEESWVEDAIVRRRQARADKDWAAADSIRDELAAKYVELNDSPDGTTWRIRPPAPEGLDG